MTQPYASLLDKPTPSALPLTDRSASYLRSTIDQIESEIARLVNAEVHYQQEAAGAKAVRELLEETRDRYRRDLGEHAAPMSEPQRWPVDPDVSLGSVAECSVCSKEMAWTEKYGFVHEVDGWWVVAGEWCAQPVSPSDDDTQETTR